MATPYNPSQHEQTTQTQAEDLTYQLSKFFARRSGVLITDTSLVLLGSILRRQLWIEGGDPAVERLIDALKEENAGYRNEHFPD